MNYLALFLTIFFSIVVAMPCGTLLSVFADAALRWYLDYKEEEANPEPEEASKEEPKKRPVRPYSKRLDPDAERVTRTMP